MRFLAAERSALDALLPGFDRSLTEISLLDLERPGNPGIRAFRESGGAGLLIPTDYSGRGITPVEAVRVQRALATRSPSLAVATTMHQFSVVTLVEAFRSRGGPGMLLLEAIAKRGLLIASGFAEGRSGCGILAATMRAKRTPDGLVVNGSKKPCSLSGSMDLLTASVIVEGEAGKPDEFAILLIPAQSPGIERQPYWKSWILAGAESDEVVLTDVMVPIDLASFAGPERDRDTIEIAAFIWFELLITASYLGMASGLAERVLTGNRANHSDRVRLAIELESAMAAIEGIAQLVAGGSIDQHVLARMLLVRYAVEGAIGRASNLAVELLGGIAFIRSPEIAYLLSASQALGFHPPSRTSMSQPIIDYLAGGPLAIP
jgi:alkylation response protein AidB-like acyl-CoA dehydrogenase